ncbi:MAG TPA: PQQ-binding-like beta-propeller repeat protein [Bryobacteraceae bacterium]|nr:PQQ-binding-like beta-propeller repeat protein [Bryobacteraceae bacterium]
MKQGDAGLETLGSLDGARHGAGNVWIPGNYDPETHLYIFGTGSLTSPNNGGATNWPPPAYSPDTGLFYVPTNEAYSMYYLTETDPRGAMGLGGKEEDGLGTLGSCLTAIDYKTGKVAWRHRYPGTSGSIGSGMLTTAGKLLFAGDLGGNLVAYNPADGKILWHSHIGQVSNAPETYQLDGHQYILAAADDSLYAVLIGYLFNLFSTSARNLSMNPST